MYAHLRICNHYGLQCWAIEGQECGGFSYLTFTRCYLNGKRYIIIKNLVVALARLVIHSLKDDEDR